MYRKSIYTKERTTELEMNSVEIEHMGNTKDLQGMYKFTGKYSKTGKNREELWPVRRVRTFQIFVVSATLSVVAHIMSLLILSLFWKVYGCGELQGFPQPFFLIRQYFFRPGKNRK